MILAEILKIMCNESAGLFKVLASAASMNELKIKIGCYNIYIYIYISICWEKLGYMCQLQYIYVYI